MRYGHGPGGIVGILLNEHALCRWALNLHICSRLTKDIAYLKEDTLFEVGNHKEESHSRIKADDDNRNAIKDKLDTCVDPLDVAQGQNLINIVTVKMSNKNVNVENAVQIGEAHTSNRLVSQVLPNDQEEGSYHEGRQEEARSGSNETVLINYYDWYLQR